MKKRLESLRTFAWLLSVVGTVTLVIVIGTGTISPLWVIPALLLTITLNP